MTGPRRLRAAVVVAASAAVIGHGAWAIPTGATYTDASSTSGATLVAGTLVLSSSRSADWVLGTGANGIHPGAGGALVGAITVTNTGSLGLRYSITSRTAENTTAARLFLEIRTGVTSCTAAGFGESGTAAGPATSLGTTAEVAVLGDPATGSQPGDRSLAAGAAETLCARVSLLPGGGRSDSGLAATGATFRFWAENG